MSVHLHNSVDMYKVDSVSEKDSKTQWAHQNFNSKII